MTIRLFAAACAAFLACMLGTQSADAQALDRIIKDKKIRITAELTSPPFGILDKDNKPTGSEVETARQLAKDLGVELELVQVTGPQRIPALLVGPRRSGDLVALDHGGTREVRVVFKPARRALDRDRRDKEREHQERRRPRRQSGKPLVRPHRQ